MANEAISDEDIAQAWDWFAALERWPDDETPEEMVQRIGVGESGVELAVTAVLSIFLFATPGEWPKPLPVDFAFAGRNHPRVRQKVLMWARVISLLGDSIRGRWAN